MEDTEPEIKCWCGHSHPRTKHHVANWKLYFIRKDDEEKSEYKILYGEPYYGWAGNRRAKR